MKRPSFRHIAGSLLGLMLLLAIGSAHSRTPVYFCNDPGWMPIDYTDSNGQPRGIAVDTLRYLFDHHLTDYRLLHWKTETWAGSLKAFGQRKCVILAEAVATPRRRQFMLFTQPILEYPLVFITRRDYPMLRSLQDVGDAVIARQKSSALITILRRRLPGVRIMEVPDTASAYLAVAAGKADIVIAVAPVARAMISQLALDNLVINGKTGMDYAIRIAVHKAYPQLRDRLDAAIVKMPLSERVRIQSFYTGSELNPRTPHRRDLQQGDWFSDMIDEPSFIFILILTALALLLFLLLWRQKRKARQRELDALTGLASRHVLNEALPRLMRQAGPEKPLCLIAADIDHFKQINDQYGHLTGDKVLQQVADILQQLAREQDMVVRWGGEEFLWLCPNTPFKRACALAERLREQVQLAFRDHPTLPPVTLSAGVAQYQKGESQEAFIQRADEALYRAKRLGRNRISCTQAPPETILDL